MTDISDAKRETALLSWLQQYAPYGVFTLDESLRVKSWNRWMELHSSLPMAAVVGRSLFDVFPDLRDRKLTLYFERALAGESSVFATALHHYLLPLHSRLSDGKDGRMRQTARISPLPCEDQRQGVIVVIEDVTQREIQAESLMRQHRRDEALSWALIHLLKTDEPRKTVRQLFFKIAEHLDFDTFFLYLRDEEGGAIKLYAAGGVADDLEEEFRSFTLLADASHEPNPVFFNGISDSSDPQFALLKKAKISSLIAVPLQVESKNLGTLCFASWSRARIAADETELLTTVAQYLATAVDKESTSRQLKKAVEANYWMGAIVKYSDDAIISKDLDGIIKSCNQGAARLFGYEIADLVGKPMRVLIPGDHQTEEDDILRRIREGKRTEQFETVRRRKDGSLIEVALMISPVIDASGTIIGVSSIARDITSQRVAEQKLNESYHREKLAREKAEQANRTKDNFLAALSHELRTPLNPALLIASESADNHQLPEAVRLNFDTIRKNIELEASLIDDLLDLTRITEGKMVLNTGVVDVHQILADAIETTRAEHRKKALWLDVRLNAPESLVEGDSVRLQQVFWNVLKNAGKFTPPKGKVTVETSVDHAGHLLVKVADTGIGMSGEEMARIFTAFAQGNHAAGGDSHRFGGLGLGLAISRNLVELHSGKITAASPGVGQGAVFTISLPLLKTARQRPTTRTKPGEPAAAGTFETSTDEICVLLVEDHDVTRDVMSLLLRRRNYKVFTAETVAKAREIAAQNKLDVLISDVGLPDGSGNDLMEELRRLYGLKGIALTGYGMEDDIERGRAAGFVAHLIKPVRIHTLESALQMLKKGSG